MLGAAGMGMMVERWNRPRSTRPWWQPASTCGAGWLNGSVSSVCAFRMVAAGEVVRGVACLGRRFRLPEAEGGEDLWRRSCRPGYILGMRTNSAAPAALRPVRARLMTALFACCALGLVQCTGAPQPLRGGHPVGLRMLDALEREGVDDSAAVRQMTWSGMTLDEWVCHGVAPTAELTLGTTVDRDRTSSNATTVGRIQTKQLLAALEWFGIHSRRAVALLQQLAADGAYEVHDSAVGTLWYIATGSTPNAPVAAAAIESLGRSLPADRMAELFRKSTWGNGRLLHDGDDERPLPASLTDAVLAGWRRAVLDRQATAKDLVERIEAMLATEDEDERARGGSRLASIESDAWSALLRREDVSSEILMRAMDRIRAFPPNTGSLGAALADEVSQAWQRLSSHTSFDRSAAEDAIATLGAERQPVVEAAAARMQRHVELAAWSALARRVASDPALLASATNEAAAPIGAAPDDDAAARLTKELAAHWQALGSTATPPQAALEAIQQVAFPVAFAAGWAGYMSRRDLDLPGLVGASQPFLEQFGRLSAQKSLESSALREYAEAWLRLVLDARNAVELLAVASGIVKFAYGIHVEGEARRVGLPQAFLDHRSLDGDILVVLVPWLSDALENGVADIEPRLTALASRTPPLGVTEDARRRLCQWIDVATGIDRPASAAPALPSALVRLLVATHPQVSEVWRLQALVQWRAGEREECMAALARAEALAQASGADVDIVAVMDLRNRLEREANWTDAARRGALRTQDRRRR